MNGHPAGVAIDGLFHGERLRAQRMRRLNELVDLVRDRYSKDDFFATFRESCREDRCKAHAYRTYEDALRFLDERSWDTLKMKAIRHFRQHRTGQLKQGFFDQLNEAFAYRHLVRRGYHHVQILQEDGNPVPDLSYFDGTQQLYCEVKTIDISGDEINRRTSCEAYSNAYASLEAPFFKKLRDHLTKARSQLKTRNAEGIVYVIMVFDDITFEHYRNYRRQLAEFAKAENIDNVHLKMGLRFNRRMELNSCNRYK